MRYSPLARSKLIYFLLTAKVTTKTWQISRNFHKTFVQLFKCSSLWHQWILYLVDSRSSKPWGADIWTSHTREPVSWQCPIGYLVQQHEFLPFACPAWSCPALGSLRDHLMFCKQSAAASCTFSSSDPISLSRWETTWLARSDVWKGWWLVMCTPDWCMVTQFHGSFDSWWRAAAVVRCTWL